MAYSTSNPPFLVSKGIGGKGNTFQYESTDASTVVDNSGYITNAKDLGFVVNDTVIVIDTDATPPLRTIHTVVTINADGSSDLSNNGGTNTD